MSEETRVYVIAKKGRKSLYLMANDPLTGKRIERSASTLDEKAAQRLAYDWERELRDGFSGQRVTWVAFKDQYIVQASATNAQGTIKKAQAVFRAIDRLCKPKLLSQVNTRRIGLLTTELLKAGRSVETVKGHLRHLKVSLRWAHENEMLIRVPKIKMPKGEKGAKLMKGRPITAEEFDRMLAKVESIVDADKVDAWKHLLRGLWWSGLRIGESLTLTWDQWADGLIVDTSGKYVMLRIPASGEKGGRNRLYPVAPEFAEFLLATPEEDRTGFVFNPVPARVVKNERATDQTASRTLSRIGESAGVVVDKKDDNTLYASAHDIRRAFGFRWSRRVMPAVLKELMRHADIGTTMKFYVGTQAEATAEMLYKAMGVEQPTATLQFDRSAESL
jgi:integrase